MCSVVKPSRAFLPAWSPRTWSAAPFIKAVAIVCTCLLRRGACPWGVQTLAQSLLLALGLLLVVPEHLGDIGIVCGGDHRVEHPGDVLLHSVGVLDVMD